VKQVLQDMAKGGTTVTEAPAPHSSREHVLIHTTTTLISAGTERMLVGFGKASYLDKARQQPEKVKMVLEKVATDGLMTTIEAVQSKLAQPLPLGYCNVGVVAEVGAGVDGFKLGDRVVSNGPHADVVKVPKNLCARIPDAVDDESAAFVVVAYFWIVGFSNAVNLTDGLDGLAIMPTVLVAGALGVFAYVSGNAVFSQYLQIPAVPGAGELAIVCAAIAGAGLGFLWFNTYPAMVFMGDIGALALGAALGAIAVIVRQELVLVVMGGVFVLETVSVMLQVASFKLTGRRVFRMAPIHHHFELKGWPEPRVIVRFWIISVVLVLVGLATLKVR